MDASDVDRYDKEIPVATVKTADREVRFFVPNRHILWRVETLFTKEPETIAWISEFEAGDVFFDVGANVGLYSIWAALSRGVQVFAFEPEAQNYAVLNRNILLNELDGSVKAYNLALGDENRLDSLYLATVMAGGSCHAFGEKRNFDLRAFEPKFVQGCVSLRLDDAIAQFGLPAPNHLKIDVDGFEHKIIAYARDTLASPVLKSVLIELNQKLDEHMKIIDVMAEFGFGYSEEQVSAAGDAPGAPSENLANYILRR